MRNKIITIIVASIMSLTLVSCTTETKAQYEKETNKVLEETPIKQEEYYAPGEFVDIKDERGLYKFSVKSAKVLEAKPDVRGKVLQVTYEYENVDFTGEVEINGEVIKNIAIIDQYALKVKDSDGYILEAMNSAWGEEWKTAKPAAFGEKCLAKYTFILEEDQNIDDIFVSFSRLDKEFKIPVDGL